MIPEQFSIYPEMKYIASAAAQGIGSGDKIQITPDLENFKLERFKDLRMKNIIDKEYRFKLMLIGSSKTNVFIDGPDNLVDILITMLPSYIGKRWIEINKIILKKSFINCRNFLIDDKCNAWIIDTFEMKEYNTEEISYNSIEDMPKADEICAKCKNFNDKE